MNNGHWIWQEFGGMPIIVSARKGESPDDALARHFVQHDEFRKEHPKDSRPLREFLPEVTPGTLRWFPSPRQLAKATSGAYSVDRFTSWTKVCAMLLARGFDGQECEAILRSKWTRWASDASDKPYGKATADDLARFIDGQKKKLKQEVADLVREMFASQPYKVAA